MLDSPNRGSEHRGSEHQQDGTDSDVLGAVDDGPSIHELETLEMETDPDWDSTPHHGEVAYAFRPPSSDAVQRPRLWRINPQMCSLLTAVEMAVLPRN